MTIRPQPDEAAEYYFKYIDQVPAGNVVHLLDAQLAEAAAQFRSISDEASTRRYAPDKWSIRQVISHVNDTERLFVFRALWFARGFDSALPSFDQEVAIAAAAADGRSWDSLVDEFAAIRRASVTFFASLPDEAWSRRGVASGNPFSVRALAYLTAGHVTHHLTGLRAHYRV